MLRKPYRPPTLRHKSKMMSYKIDDKVYNTLLVRSYNKHSVELISNHISTYENNLFIFDYHSYILKQYITDTFLKCNMVHFSYDTYKEFSPLMQISSSYKDSLFDIFNKGKGRVILYD